MAPSLKTTNHEIFKDCLSSAVLDRYASSSSSSRDGAAKGAAMKKRAARRQRRRGGGGGERIQSRIAGGASRVDGVERDGSVGLCVDGDEDGGDSVERDVDELGDFVEFLSSEIFDALSAEARTLSYSKLQQESRSSGRILAEKYLQPLPYSTREELVQVIGPSVADTLTAYSLISPPETNLFTFLTPVLDNYIAAVTAGPPAWHSTRTSACEICGRDWIPLSYHHLIPKAVHAKALKRGWHDEHMLNKVAWLCWACHSFVHRMAGNEDLAREWHEVEKILEREDVQRWRSWVGGVRWKKR